MQLFFFFFSSIQLQKCNSQLSPFATLPNAGCISSVSQCRGVSGLTVLIKENDNKVIETSANIYLLTITRQQLWFRLSGSFKDQWMRDIIYLFITFLQRKCPYVSYHGLGNIYHLAGLHSFLSMLNGGVSNTSIRSDIKKNVFPSQMVFV